MLLPNILTAEPYNITRIWIGKKLSTWSSKRTAQIVRDTITFIIYRVPLIFLTLLILGAPLSNVLTVCLAATAIAGFTGRPYGIFLDWMRRRFHIT
jgi:hypothetical protein